MTNHNHCDTMLWRQAMQQYARVVELVDSLDSGSSAHSGHAGSSPASRTKKSRPSGLLFLFVVHPYLQHIYFLFLVGESAAREVFFPCGFGWNGV